MKPIKTAILARVSTDEQKKFGFSTESQLDKLRAYAKENNLLIVDEYVDEGFSAGTMKRPDLQRLLGDLDKIDLIIFTRLDRFSRNVLDANEMVKLFNKKNVSIKAIEEDDIDTSTADGMFMFNLKVSLAQRELAKGSERIATVFEYKVKSGQPITGNLPWGYKIGEKNGVKCVEKDKEVAPIIEEVFKHFITYQSVRQTALYINDKYGLERVYNTYTRLLKNPIYAGYYRGNKDYCTPYVTMETFALVQELLKRNIRTQKRSNTVYLFTGLITCPTCGRKMRAISYPKKTTTLVYYRCYRRMKDKSCDDLILHNVNEKMIEKFLLNNIEMEIEKYIYNASVELEKVKKPKVNIKAITDEIDRLNLLFRKGRIDEKEYDCEYEILEKKLADAQKDVPEEKDLSGLEDFLNSGWRNVYENLSREDKRALFRTIIKSITKDKAGEWVIEFLL